MPKPAAWSSLNSARPSRKKSKRPVQIFGKITEPVIHQKSGEQQGKRTSAAGLRAWEAEKAARAEKERQKAEATQQREAREAAARAIRDARVLDISLSGSRNNPERISLIQAQLDGRPQLKDDPKFTGLYGRLLASRVTVAFRNPSSIRSLATFNEPIIHYSPLCSCAINV
ncbi:hypothetical protein BDR04DRAFT_1229594 [Suillus decipiens]|nr:hypothetical protein BDR04DRAFT_1229594 [Suillus decipiens]